MRYRSLGRLRHQLFVWLALTILATLVVVTLVVWGMRDGEGPFVTRLRQAGGFAAEQLAARWDDEIAREAFVRDLGRAFGANMRLTDAHGRELTSTGSIECRGFRHHQNVQRGGTLLGQLQVCFAGHRHFDAGSAASVLAAVCLVLWVAAALVARWLAQPLSLLIDTTREIGSGNLDARARLGRHAQGELGLLADSVNEMAERLERQLREQRELLAAVSHEVRSPLARLRVSAEVLRGNARDASALLALEREVDELDVLVGKLLANSRLDFGLLGKRPIEAAELWAELLERRNLPADLLSDLSAGARVSADPTLIARALENLLDNAARHAGTVSSCVLSLASSGTEHEQPDRVGSAALASLATPAPVAPDRLVFEVCDRGPGFSAAILPHAFDAFHRGSAEHAGSLGLGLALVSRIARAHGGRAWAENVPGGGARVAFSVALDAVGS